MLLYFTDYFFKTIFPLTFIVTSKKGNNKHAEKVSNMYQQNICQTACLGEIIEYLYL